METFTQNQRTTTPSPNEVYYVAERLARRLGIEEFSPRPKVRRVLPYFGPRDVVAIAEQHANRMGLCVGAYNPSDLRPGVRII